MISLQYLTISLPLSFTNLYSWQRHGWHTQIQWDQNMAYIIHQAGGSRVVAIQFTTRTAQHTQALIRLRTWLFKPLIPKHPGNWYQTVLGPALQSTRGCPSLAISVFQGDSTRPSFKDIREQQNLGAEAENTRKSVRRPSWAVVLRECVECEKSSDPSNVVHVGSGHARLVKKTWSQLKHSWLLS